MESKTRKNLFSNYSDEKLIKTRNQLTGFFVSLIAVIVIAFVALAYLLILHQSDNESVSASATLLTIPVILLPIIILMKIVEDEIKKRNLN